MNKNFVPLASFYITNVCGLACDRCASYNNYVLKGHYDWNATKERAHKWNELIDIGQITIIGGEPLLHPNIDEWVMGVRTAFPNCKDIRVLTGLTGDSLVRHKDKILKWLDHDVIIQVSVHDKNWWDAAIRAGREIVKDIGHVELEEVDGGNFPLKRSDFRSHHGKMLFCALEQWEFFAHSLKETVDGVMYFHNNDPEAAHDACHCKDCHYIVDGIMYKCVMTGIAKMLVEQAPLDERSVEVLKQTQGIDPLTDEYRSLTNAVPQCSLCSTNTEKLIPIWPVGIKKPRMYNVNR